MQAAGLNSLLALLTPGTGAAAGLSLFDDAQAGAGTDLFSQLLGDFNGGQGGAQNPAGNSALAALLAPGQSGLLAQEVLPTGAAATGPIAQLTQLLNRSISPAQAGRLAAQLDEQVGQSETNTANAGASQGDAQLWQQLKQELVQLSHADEPQTVAQLVQGLPAAQQKAAVAEIQKAAQGGTMGRVLQWLQAALAKSNSKESPTQDAADGTETLPGGLDATAQSLQASLFRPVDADAVAPTPAEDKKNEVNAAGVPATAIVLVPVNQQLAVPGWVAQIAPQPTLGSTGQADAVIPPLVDHDVAANTLPEVELPSVAPKPDAAATAKADHFVQHLSNTVLPSASVIAQAASTTTAAASTKEDTRVADTMDLTDLTKNPVTATSASAGAAPTQTAQAVQAAPIVLPQGVINHAPVAEQVHVALSRAAKENIDTITIQLEPATLGRIEVKMHLHQDGTAHISFTADTAETFDALSRDAHQLEASLQQSGIKADAGGMQFNLRQQPQPQFSSDTNGEGQRQQTSSRDEEDRLAIDRVETPVKRATISIRDGIDIHA